MRNNILPILAIVMALSLSLLSWFTYSLWAEYQAYKAVNSSWLNKTEARINKLQDTQRYVQNVCEQYLAEEQLLMDYGNDHSDQ